MPIASWCGKAKVNCDDGNNGTLDFTTSTARRGNMIDESDGNTNALLRNNAVLQVTGHLLQPDLPVHGAAEQDEEVARIRGARHPPGRRLVIFPTHV